MSEREKLEGLLDEMCEAAYDSARADTELDGFSADSARKAFKASRKAILALFDAQSPHPWVRICDGCEMPEVGRKLDVACHRGGRRFVVCGVEVIREFDTHWRYHTPVPHPDDVAAKGGG